MADRCKFTPRCLVGILSTYDKQTGEEGSNPMEIYSDQEIFVGRNHKKCYYVVDDPLVSNQHLRMYTVVFDPENPEEVAPLVYAQDISSNGTKWNEYPMGGRGSFLLGHGDILKISPSVSLRYVREDHFGAREFSPPQQAEMQLFRKEFVITPRKLGSGAFGKVYMAYRRANGQQLACKIIDLQVLKDRKQRETEIENSKYFITEQRNVMSTPEMRNTVTRKITEKLKVYDREAMILETLQHPNIIRVEKVVKSRNTVYIFQELITAGDLFSYIQHRGGRLIDIEASVIVRQILMALDYLHDRNIVHRDLKPDNILMTSRVDGCRVIVTDFGCATMLRPSMNRMSTVVGTFEFTAPEVLRTSREGYTKAIDLWSLGSVTAVLLTGEPPFEALRTKSCTTELARKRGIAELEASMERNKVGPRARDFVRKLLVFDERARLNAKQALQHDWFTNRSHKHEFEALYGRAMRDWKPRAPKKPMIVGLHSYFETTNDACRTKQCDEPTCPSGSDPEEPWGLEDCLAVDNRTSPPRRLPESPPVSTGDSLSGETLRGVSQTLSDLNLPPHGNFEELDPRH